MAFKEIKEVILSGLDSKAYSLVREYDRNLSFREIKKLWRLSTQRIDSPFVAEYIMNNSSHSWKLDPIDKRPSGVNSFTLACELNLQGVVKLLLTDNRIDPTIGDG